MASSIRSRRRRWRAHEMLLLRRTHASRRVPPSRVAVIADGALGEAAPAHTLDAETIGLQMAGISTDATDAA